MSTSTLDALTMEGVLEYYDSESSIFEIVDFGDATDAEIAEAFGSTPSMQIDKAINGDTLGMSYNAPVITPQTASDNVLGSIDSNGLASKYSTGATANYAVSYNTWDGTTPPSIDSGKFANAASRVAAATDRVSLGVVGVNIGCKLGKAFDSLIYQIDPNWWDANYPSINPDTWPSICGEDEEGEKFFRTLFNINDDKQTTAYIDARVMAQTYQMLRDLGVLKSFESATLKEPVVLPQTHPSFYYISNSRTYIGPIEYIVTNYFEYHNPSSPARTYELTFSSPVTIVIIQVEGESKIINYISETPFTMNYKSYKDSDGTIYNQGTRTSSTFTDEGFPRVEAYGEILNANTWSPNISLTHHSSRNLTPTVSPKWSPSSELWYVIQNGEFDTSGGYEGVTDIEGATQYPPDNITGTTMDEVTTQLQTEYPDLFEDAINEITLQPDGTTRTQTYVPIPWQIANPTNKKQRAPTTTVDPSTSTIVAPDTATQIVVQTENKTKTQTDNPDTGEGTANLFPLPTGNASSLWAVYHPSQSQLNAFGAWLWSSDFVEQLKRLFNDPMQAIIGVHKVFAPIPTDGSSTIKCGYLDSGVSSPTVSSQYTEVNCGTVNCREYFGNVFDYDPHTKVSIYLPFIGVVPLKVSEVMRASITVTYGVDVITGACLAKVKVMRDGGGAILYSYGGSCACHYPISSGSYAGIISGIATSAIGIAGGIVTGSPLSAIGGAMAGLHQAHTDVQRSGGFTGCAGAMGPKIPYLIIDRPQTRLAADFEAYQGKPANSTQFIGDCSGFVRATEVHFSAPGAFDDEAKEIEALLKSGVILD